MRRTARERKIENRKRTSNWIINCRGGGLGGGGGGGGGGGSGGGDGGGGGDGDDDDGRGGDPSRCWFLTMEATERRNTLTGDTWKHT